MIKSFCSLFGCILNLTPFCIIPVCPSVDVRSSGSQQSELFVYTSDTTPHGTCRNRRYYHLTYIFLYSYYTIYFLSIQVFGPIPITSVTSMDMSYISIAEARGFTTHLIKLKKQLFFFKLFLQFSNKDKGVKRSGLIQVKVKDCICTLFFSAGVHDLHILRE